MLATIWVAAAIAPTVAGARSEVLTLPRGFGPLGDPQAVLVGDRIVYRDPLTFDRVVLRVAGPHGEDALLAPLGVGRVWLAASDSLLAVVHDSDLLTGPAVGPLVPISHCADGAPAVDGPNVAYVEAAAAPEPWSCNRRSATGSSWPTARVPTTSRSRDHTSPSGTRHPAARRSL